MISCTSGPKPQVILSDQPALSICLYVLACCSNNMAFGVIYLHTPESMPTEIRSTGMSVANTIARVGGLIAPYIALVVSMDELICLYTQHLDRNTWSNIGKSWSSDGHTIQTSRHVGMLVGSH